MARFSAVLDACVLVPIALADTLLRLAEADLYRPLWSERIIDLDPDVVIRVLHAQAAATQRPAINFDALLDHLARCGVPRFAHAAAQQRWRSP